MRRQHCEHEELLFLCAMLSLGGGATSAPVVYGFNKPVEPTAGEFPFQASLMQPLAAGSYHSFCGGSLIHPEWVLTAAHCIQLDDTTPAMKPQGVHVAFGSIYRSAKGAQIVPARALTIHPRYLSSGGRHDIGLVRLSRRVRLSKRVKLVRLHRSNAEDLLGETAFLTGFGIINDLYQEPERLRKATLKIERYSKCFSDRESADKELCGTSTLANGKACKGDSGGPLTINRKGNLVQIGVTSRLALLPFCRLGFNHSVYTRVSHYVAWISRVTGVDFSKYNASK